MRVFGFPHAGHYCKSSASAATSIVPGSFWDHAKSLPAGSLTEGTPQFDIYRAHALADAERSLFLAISHYRRLLDLMAPSAAPWAEVTAYYGSFHAARAILHMFGCAVVGTGRVVEVEAETPGFQKLRVTTRAGAGLPKAPHSHQAFWTAFYIAVAPIMPVFDASVRFALMPIGSPTTLSQYRNDVNYDSYNSLRSAERFASDFDAHVFPGSLSGTLGTQYRVLEAMLSAAFWAERQLRPATSALEPFFGSGNLREHARSKVYSDKAPGLVRASLKGPLLRR